MLLKEAWRAWGWGDAGQGREGSGYCPVPPLIPRSGLSQIHDSSPNVLVCLHASEAGREEGIFDCYCLCMEKDCFFVFI